MHPSIFINPPNGITRIKVIVSSPFIPISHFSHSLSLVRLRESFEKHRKKENESSQLPTFVIFPLFYTFARELKNIHAKWWNAFTRQNRFYYVCFFFLFLVFERKRELCSLMLQVRFWKSCWVLFTVGEFYWCKFLFNPFCT